MELGSPKQLKIVLAVAVVLGGGYFAASKLLPSNLASYQFPPPPQMPQPNGYDLYLDAHRRFTTRPSDARVDKNQKWVRPPAGKVLPPSPTSRWVDANAATFALYAKAQNAVYLHPQVRGDTGATDRSFRSLGREKAAEAIARSERGDHNGAVQSALDIFELGLKLPRGGAIITSLNGFAIESKARAMLGPEMAYLNGPQATAAAKRLEKCLTGRVAFSDILIEDKWASLYNLQNTLNATLTDKGYGDTVIERLTRPLLIPISPRRQAQSYAIAMDELIERSKRPWSEWGQPPKVMPWQRGLIDVMHDIRFGELRTETTANLFLGRLALHAFRKTTGAYPANLQELVPRYLKAVPTDPFTGSALHYRKTAKRYWLWSLGPDMKDNGGEAIGKNDFMGRFTPGLPNKDSSGDIVAGLND